MGERLTSWAASPAYGQTVVLGPTQHAVYAVVLELTAGGRRPFLTLAQLSQRVGKPVSSVHDALGRLRALGLIGCAARMGRAGGHRLWRVVSVLGTLDTARHRRAVARILRRFPVALSRAGAEGEAPTLGLGADPDPPADAHPSAGGPFRDAMRRAGFRPWWIEGGNDRADDTDEAEGEPCVRAFVDGAGS